MKKEAVPAHYQRMREKFKPVFDSYEQLGKSIRDRSPFDERTSLLIQLAASVAIGSEGSVHSHARRALEAGATPDELYYTAIMLTTTIGWPTVGAALSWIGDILNSEK